MFIVRMILYTVTTWHLFLKRLRSQCSFNEHLLKFFMLVWVCTEQNCYAIFHFMACRTAHGFCNITWNFKKQAAHPRLEHIPSIELSIFYLRLQSIYCLSLQHFLEVFSFHLLSDSMIPPVVYHFQPLILELLWDLWDFSLGVEERAGSFIWLESWSDCKDFPVHKFRRIDRLQALGLHLWGFELLLFQLQCLLHSFLSGLSNYSRFC